MMVPSPPAQALPSIQLHLHKNPIHLLQLREASERASVLAGGAGGLSRLRWPPRRREVAETVGLLPAGGGVGSSIGPRVSRVSFPASKSRRRRRRRHGIMSSRVLPRLDGAPLRRRRRARGGGVPGVDPLYRSPRPAACRQVSPLAFCSMDPRHAVGFVEVGWPDRARLHLGGGGRRWRARIWELQRSGRVPGRWATAEGFFYCDSNQSHGAKGPLQLTVELVFLGGGGGRRGGRLLLVREGSRDLDVIFFFLRVLRAVWLLQLSLYPWRMCLYSYVFMYVALN